MASATTGPKDPSADSVQISTASPPTAPFRHSTSVVPNTVRAVSRMTVLVTAVVRPSRHFMAVCFSPRVSLWAAIPAARAAVSLYWMVSRRPRRLSST